MRREHPESRYAKDYARARQWIEATRAEQNGPQIERTFEPQGFEMLPVTTGKAPNKADNTVAKVEQAMQAEAAQSAMMLDKITKAQLDAAKKLGEAADRLMGTSTMPLRRQSPVLNRGG
jgi:hypothetical protein